MTAFQEIPSVNEHKYNTGKQHPRQCSAKTGEKKREAVRKQPPAIIKIPELKIHYSSVGEISLYPFPCILMISISGSSFSSLRSLVM